MMGCCNHMRVDVWQALAARSCLDELREAKAYKSDDFLEFFQTRGGHFRSKIFPRAFLVYLWGVFFKIKCQIISKIKRAGRGSTQVWKN